LSIKILWDLRLGRNLVQRGITEAEARYLLDNDIKDFEQQLSDRLYWFDGAPDTVKLVLTDMCFNLGVAGLLQFHNTLEHIKNENYQAASIEMLKSLWAKQVGNRAIELSIILKST
jgi:lysozyme